MSKYESLAKFLASSNASELVMTFTQLEQILGAPLPTSARTHRPWWANSAHGHVQSKGWLDAGYESQQVDLQGEKLTFKKIESNPATPSAAAQSKSGRHPLIGWAVGTVKILPGVDLTTPMYIDEEMETFLNEKSAKIAAGLQR
jgi:hypothetical protein